jgi:von Willebrand factor
MQCDPECSNYSPCIESCPVETCDNMMHPLKNERLCSTDNCVEGCKLKGCPIGSVYKNDSHAECVPKSICKPICLQENGITYYDGDEMASDACHTCKCTRGSKVCVGIPCATESPPIAGDLFGCETGWTTWINQDSLDDLQNMITSKTNYYKEDDIEPLPNTLHFVRIF